jgi:hypothetical protein
MMKLRSLAVPFSPAIVFSPAMNAGASVAAER